MKKMLFLYLSFTASLLVFGQSISISDVFNINLNTSNNIEDSKTTIIFHILTHTYENNIHKMRNEDQNKVYTNPDGREAVYDKNGQLVTNEYNKGSYNYGSYDKPLTKFLVDILPWIAFGNSPEDPTNQEERLFYYLKDLNYGIQTFIFKIRKENYKQIAYNELTLAEQEVIQFFFYILFNPKFIVLLESNNYEEMENSSQFYYSYFNQIIKLFGY